MPCEMTSNLTFMLAIAHSDPVSVALAALK
jgi:hypothetical protein